MKKIPVIMILIFFISMTSSAVMAQSIQFDAITQAHIMAEPLSSVKINGSDDDSNQIPTGTILVYQTSDGRYGKMEIENYGYDLTLTWKTFDDFDRTFSEGSKLVIHGSWFCDLDKGIEISSGTESDFFWQQYDSIMRHLSPENNAQFAVYTPKPDLVVSSGTPKVSPASVMPGDTVTLSPWTVKNTGTDFATAFSNGFYLSADPVITAGDIYLDGNANSDLPPGQQFDWGGPTLTIPATTLPGSYYIGILVDRNSAVVESDDTNNYVSVPITVGQPLPDLVIASGTPTVTPASIMPGDTVTLSPWTVKNIGTGDSGNFSIGFYLSVDRVITANDIYLTGKANTNLAPDQQFDWGSLMLTIPSSIAPGSYHIGILVDHSDKIDESDDTNNSVSAPLTVDSNLAAIGLLKAIPKSGIVPVSITFNTFIGRGKPPFTYEYSFGDGNQIINGTSQETHTYQKKGSYTAKVRVTDASGKVYEFFRNILVIDNTDLTTYQTNLNTKADQIKLIVTADDIPNILFDAQDIIDKSLSSITNADDATKKEVRTAVQNASGKLITNTKDKFVDFITNNQIQLGDIQNTLTGLNNVVSNMVKNDVPMSENIVKDLQTISENIFSVTLDTLLAKENLSATQLNEIKNDNDKARTFLKDKKYLLPDIVRSTAIQADVLTDFDAADINTIADKHKLTERQTANLHNAVVKTIDIEKTITQDSIVSQTITDIVLSLFKQYIPSQTISTYAIEPVTKNILLTFTKDARLSFSVKNISIAGNFMPKGLFDLPDGSMLGIIDSYAITLVSYPVFPLDFTAEVIKIGDTVLGRDGSLQVDLGTNLTVSCGFSWIYYQMNTLNSLTTSFSVTGGVDPAAETYSLVVTYDTGLSQLIPPSILALDDITQMLDELIPADYSIDGNTGVLTLGTLAFKPDYSFTHMTSINSLKIIQSGGFLYGSLGFELKDFNGDGLTDVGFYSNNPMGLQILFSVLP